MSLSTDMALGMNTTKLGQYQDASKGCNIASVQCLLSLCRKHVNFFSSEEIISADTASHLSKCCIRKCYIYTYLGLLK